MSARAGTPSHSPPDWLPELRRDRLVFTMLPLAGAALMGATTGEVPIAAMVPAVAAGFALAAHRAALRRTRSTASKEPAPGPEAIFLRIAFALHHDKQLVDGLSPSRRLDQRTYDQLTELIQSLREAVGAAPRARRQEALGELVAHAAEQLDRPRSEVRVRVLAHADVKLAVAFRWACLVLAELVRNVDDHERRRAKDPKGFLDHKIHVQLVQRTEGADGGAMIELTLKGPEEEGTSALRVFRTTKPGGWGVGLGGAKQVLEWLGGELTIGESVVRARFPLEAPTDEEHTPALPPTARAFDERGAAVSPRVLVALLVAALAASVLLAGPRIALVVPASVPLGLGVLLGVRRLGRSTREGPNAYARDAASRARDRQFVDDLAAARIGEMADAIVRDLLRVRGEIGASLGSGAADALARLKATYAGIDLFVSMKNAIEAGRPGLRRTVADRLGTTPGITLQPAAASPTGSDPEGRTLLAKLDRARFGPAPLAFTHPLSRLAALHWALSGSGGRIEVHGERATIVLAPRRP